MFRSVNRFLALAAAAGALTVVLAGPPAAFACNSGTSAVNVYKECLQTGGGSKPAGGGKSGGQSSGPASTPVSSRTSKALKHAGNDRRALYALVHNYGARRFLTDPTKGGAATEPTALGSAFDLGSGPTALLIVLAGTAALLLGGSGMRLWRGRHRA